MALGEAGQQWRHLKYLSTRLATHYLDLTALDTGGTRPVITPKLSFGLVSVETPISRSGAPFDEENPFQVAQRLEEKLRGSYAELGDEGASRRVGKGQLVRAKLLFQPAHLQIQGYEVVHPTVEPYYVVAFTCVERVPGLGRVFIGLVGSEYNLLEMPGDGIVGARSASDAEGLYDMIQYTKESAYGYDILDYKLERERKSFKDAPERERFRDVAAAFQGFAIQSVPRLYDVLFEVNHLARDIELDSLGSRIDGAGHVDLALLGAPIWVREITDRDLLSSMEIFGGPGYLEETFDKLDEELRSLIRDEGHQVAWRPESDEDWAHLRIWAAAWARRVGPEEKSLVWRPPRHQLGGLRWGGQKEYLEEAGPRGWVLHSWNQDACLLTAEGEMYKIYAHGDDAFWPGDRKPAPMKRGSRESRGVVQTTIQSVARWLLPFERER